MSNLKLTSTDGELFENPSLYHSIADSLQYLTMTKHELAYLVNKVCHFMQQSQKSHWKSVKRILRYLQGSLTLGLDFQPAPSFKLTSYIDSDWASDIEDRKSTSSFCVYFGSNLISWSSQKQASVSRSSTEAEYRGVCNLATELLTINKLLFEIHITLHVPMIYCDNQGAMLMATNPVQHSRSKHFETDLHFLRDHIAKGRLQVTHIPSDAQWQTL
ncbi:uncharacterized protein LOC107647729 [Arachis ipaensis]|uniref:uncharacterized protein LOC107647729 n=1 Tax=Arachis ipaensis TaxID=130454 RepID=UPI0007AFC081|nr:uncharacterized protein LOC107647729 [Arachis ipaensis]